MTKSDLLTLVSIVVTVLSLIAGCIGNEQPSCNINNIITNGGEVHITYNIEQ